MTVWELQARRDRAYFKQILQAKGPAGLREEVLLSLARQADRPRLNVRVARSGRATNVDATRRLQFSFLRFPDAPVEPLAGSARLSNREAMAPQLEVVNRSQRSVRHIAIGWILQDAEGRRFLAASVPADLKLAPGQKTRIVSETALRFTRPVSVEAMTGFLSQVEFDDGELWIPSRENLAAGRLDRLVGPSPEEQRLTNLYRRRGLEALIAELNKF